MGYQYLSTCFGGRNNGSEIPGKGKGRQGSSSSVQKRFSSFVPHHKKLPIFLLTCMLTFVERIVFQSRNEAIKVMLCSNTKCKWRIATGQSVLGIVTWWMFRFFLLNLWFKSNCLCLSTHGLRKCLEMF